MDYLDSKKALQHRIILMIGYVLVAVAIVTAALVLLYQAYGFGVKDGAVIQNGLTFFSSQPHPASIYVNGVLSPDKTNTRLVLPANIYQVTLARDGYRDWKRTVNLEGGNVEHFDYPLLFPKALAPKKIAAYEAAPGLMSQSPDLRWVVIQQSNSLTDFQVFDLKNPAKAPVLVALPDNLLAKASSGENLQFVEWSDDNRHVLLMHNYDGKTEFVMLDRADPAQSFNLNAALGTNPVSLTLTNKKYDQYSLYDPATGALQTTTLKQTAPQTRLQHVLAYKSYGEKMVLYATNEGAPAGKVLIKLLNGDKTYNIRTFPAGTAYLLDLTEYDGVLYVAAGAAAADRVYIYRDPIGQLSAPAKPAVVPSQVLHIPQPNYLSFSKNTQFIMAENGLQFGVYDLENKLGYNYVSDQPLDPPQLHASWMDGHRLAYASGGKLTVADYDNANRQLLMNVAPAFLPAFAPDYKYVYTLAPAAAAGQYELLQTPLLTPADL